MRRFLGALLLITSTVPLWSNDEIATKLAESGVPAISRRWTGEDYAQLLTVLQTKKVRFSKLTAAERAALIGRLTNPENLDSFGYREVSIRQKFPAFGKMLENSAPIFTDLNDEAARQPALYSDVAKMLAFQLRMTAVGVDLGEFVLASVPKEHQEAARKEGLSVMHNGFMQTVNGVQIALGEEKFFSAADRRNLLVTFIETLPKIQKIFPGDFKVELRKKFEAHRSRYSTKPEADQLEAIIEGLK